MIPRVVQVCDAAGNMGGDRHSIIEAGTQMRTAVLTMEEVMRTAGRSELHRSGRLQIESDIRTLEEGCAGMKKLILKAAAALRDDWPEIEQNKARIRETSIFFEQYQKFKATVLEFDDWRSDCYDKEDIFPQAHQIAMSLVLLCGRADEELEQTRQMLDELQNGCTGSEDPLLEFEREMAEFCDIPFEGYLVQQIRFTKDPVFKAVWTGAKNELTYFAGWFRKDASQIRMIFDFPDDRKSKEQFALSRHPADKLPESNRLILLLKKYPREIFFK